MEIRNRLLQKSRAAPVGDQQKFDVSHQSWIRLSKPGQYAAAFLQRKAGDRFKNCANLLQPLWSHRDCQGSWLAPYVILYSP